MVLFIYNLLYIFSLSISFTNSWVKNRRTISVRSTYIHSIKFDLPKGRCPKNGKPKTKMRMADEPNYYGTIEN